MSIRAVDLDHLHNSLSAKTCLSTDYSYLDLLLRLDLSDQPVSIHVPENKPSCAVGGSNNAYGTRDSQGVDGTSVAEEERCKMKADWSNPWCDMPQRDSAIFTGGDQHSPGEDRCGYVVLVKLFEDTSRLALVSTLHRWLGQLRLTFFVSGFQNLTLPSTKPQSIVML